MQAYKFTTGFNQGPRIHTYIHTNLYTAKIVRTNLRRYINNEYAYSEIEVCMGMGKTGIPWVPRDSHGNGSEISHGMGMEWELSAWEWELGRENWKKHCIL